ncbi:MAG: AAA domain-containing protein [Lentisphaerae bacterium]|nr:AAA domain-containing protein [Lentisphaerota bacterium]
MTLPTPDQIAPVSDALNRILAEMDRMLLGRHSLHRLVLAGILARGHILLEGLPGLGKTALVKAVADIMNLSFKRVQFTPDLMPGDILGSHILQSGRDNTRELVFQPGPVFCNILLADEINRASPKTQSAMLETMQERSVTLLGTTRPLPTPFFVLASQNPIELEGTYPLPEAQLDRFLFRLNVGGLDADTITTILTTRRHGTIPSPNWTIPPTELDNCFKLAGQIVLPDAVARWISLLVSASHPNSTVAPPRIKTYVRYGASPRAAIALAEAARALALLDGRPSVGFEDVRALVEPVFNHRLILNYQARLDNITPSDIATDLVTNISVANLDLPEGVSINL